MLTKPVSGILQKSPSPRHHRRNTHFAGRLPGLRPREPTGFTGYLRQEVFERSDDRASQLPKGWPCPLPRTTIGLGPLRSRNR
jgi:hypothetical protein